MEALKEAIREWLLGYAWANDGDVDANRREVNCIMSQDDWQYIDGLAEKFAGQAEGDHDRSEALGFALSTLYECHDGPHLADCPRKH